MMYLYIVISFLMTFSFSQHNHNNHAGPLKIGSVYGTVIDESNNTPIEYASVSIYKSASDELVDGGITDSNGLFNINEIPPGNFKVVIEFIGYERIIINDVSINREKGRNQNLGENFLKPKVLQNSEIIITEDKPLIEFKTDKLVYNASDDIVSKTSGSAEDVLKKVPMVQVNQDGEVSLRGNSNVKILVNGRENRMGKDVDYIPASLIEKVEVITSPSAKYDPEGMAGIINIVLHEGDEDGLNGSIKLNGRHNNHGSFDAMNGISANGNYRTGKWNLYSSTSAYNKFRGNDGYRKVITTSFPLNDTNEKYSGYYYDEDKNNDRNGYLIRLGTDYFYSDDITVNGEISYNHHIKNETNIRNNYNIDTSILESTEETSSGEDKDNYDIEGLIEVKKTFENENQELSFMVTYDFQNDSEFESMNLTDIIKDITFLDQTIHGVQIDLDYQHPISDHNQLSIGYDARINNNKESLDFNLTNPETVYDTPELYSGENNFTYKRSIHAIYGEYEHELNDNLSIKPSLRFEYVDRYISSTKILEANSIPGSETSYILGSIDDINPPINKTFFKFYPNLNITYNFDKRKSLQFGLSRRVNRPGDGGHGGGSRQIRPFPRDIYNENFIFIGNPELKPEYSDQAEISLKLPLPMGFFMINTHYHTLENAITWFDDDSQEDKDIITFDNAEGGTEYGIGFYGMIMGQRLGGGWTKTVLDDPSETYELNDESQHYNLFMGIEFPEKYIKLFSFEFGFYWMKIVQPGGSLFGENGTIWANLGLSKSFLNNQLDISMGIDNLFNQGGFQMKSTKPLDATDYDIDLYESAIEDTDINYQGRGRTYSISLKFNFGKMQETAKNRRRGHQHEGGGGMDMGY